MKLQELLGPRVCAERNQEEVGAERTRLGLHPTLGRVDRRDTGLDEADAVPFQGRKAGSTLFERSRAD
jgi:hypothetical protein